MTTTEERYVLLVEAVKLLAAPFDLQRKEIPEYAPLAYELITTFQDDFFLLSGLIRENRVSNDATAELIFLYQKVEVINRNESLFTDDAVQNSAEWAAVRDLANRVLEILNEHNTNPNLSHITWVK